MAKRARLILTAQDLASGKINRVAGGLKLLGGVAAAVGAVQIGRTLVRGMTDAVQAANVQDQADARLAQSIRNVGLSVDKTLPSLKSMAANLQTVTGVGDEVIQKGQAMLVSMGKLTGEGLERATQAALDMGAATGNLDGAFDLVAKASVGYTSTLSRYGIILDKSIPQNEKFAAALAKIEELYGGQAAAKLATFGGLTSALGARWGDATEAIGMAITQSTVLQEVLKITAEEVLGLDKSIRDGIGSGDAEDAIRSVVLSLGDLAKVLASVGATAVNTKNLLQLVWAGMKSLALARQGVFINLMDPVLEEMQDVDLAAERVQRKIDDIIKRALEAKPAAEEAAASLGAGATPDGNGDSSLSTAGATASVEPQLFGPDREKEAQAYIEWQREQQELRLALETETSARLFAARQSMLAEWQAEWLTAERTRLYENYSAEMEYANLIGADTNAIREEYRIKDTEAHARHIEARTERERALAANQEAFDGSVNKTKEAGQKAALSAGLALARKSFAASKSGAKAMAIINTAAGVTRAFKDYQMPYAAIIAALVAAAGYAEIKTIGSQQPGFQFGGVVTGPSGIDRVGIRATAGETVLNTTPAEGRAILGGRAAVVPAGAGGGGGDVYVTIQANDAKSVYELLRTDPDEFARTLRYAQQREAL